MIRTTVLLMTISLLAPACGDDTGATGSGGDGGAGGEGSGPSTSTGATSTGATSTSSAATGGEGGQGSGTAATSTSTAGGGEPGTPCEAWAQAIETVSAEIGCPSQITPGLCADFENLSACVAESEAYLECEAAGTTVDNCYCEGGGTASDDFACDPTCEDESAALAVCQATGFGQR